MIVFYCRNCGFFQNWDEKKSSAEEKVEKKTLLHTHEGFSSGKKKILAETNFSHCQKNCPVCGKIGLLSSRGASIQWQISIKKMCFPVKEENTFFYLVRKSSFTIKNLFPDQDDIF